MTCSDCGNPFDDWTHNDKNKLGHFFHADGVHLIVGREDKEKPVPPKKPRVVREPKMPTLQDYKWWVRSYRRQKIIHELAQHRLMAHEVAVERLVVSPDPPPPEVTMMVLSPEVAAELRAMVDQLSHKLEIRKRLPKDEKRRAEG